MQNTASLGTSPQTQCSEYILRLHYISIINWTICPYNWTQFSPAPNPLRLSWFHMAQTAAATAKLLQSCLTLCNPTEGTPPGSPVPGIFQARTLEWVAISFSNAWKWKVKGKSLSRVRLFTTPWTAAYQAPPSMGFSRQEYWSGVPLPSPNGSNYSPLITRLVFLALAAPTMSHLISKKISVSRGL